jgi:two-component system, OmpR family, response regulator
VTFRIVHIDDDADIRKVVELSLSLDPAFMVVSCSNGYDALLDAERWPPDLVLCDVMMPGMDGLSVIRNFHESERTARVPVVFMTACAQEGEIERLLLLGAAAVFTKPFDPMTLAAKVRNQIRSVKLDAACYNFSDRLRCDAALLAEYRRGLVDNPGSPTVPDGLETCVHKLSGAAGVFNFKTVSSTASAVEIAIIERRAGRGSPGIIEAKLDALLECMERA